ncbi:MAG: hypothetical protein AB9917_19235 [Negativicutes bacterium]
MNSKWKYTLVGLVVAGLLLTVSWRLSGASLARVVQQHLLQTTATSGIGVLSVGTVDFSLSGALVANQVELKDKSGALIASARNLTIDLDMSDLLSRRLDISRIRKLDLDGLVLHISRWNITETTTKTSATPAVVFRGKVFAGNATVTVETIESRYDFKNVNGTLDFANYPNLAMDLRSNSGVSNLAAKGTWDFSRGGNMQVSANQTELGSFAPNIPLKGPITAKFVLDGTTDKPTVSGSFQIPDGNLNHTVFSDALGNFSLIGSKLSLSGVKMNALGGSITVNGPVAIDTLLYSLKISGQNVDSAYLSDKDIRGRIGFIADAQGQGVKEGPTADGTFQMGAGSISGVAFEALTGNFAKRGAHVRYYNIRVTIAGQTIYIGDADSLDDLKIPFLTLVLPGAVPAAPKLPQVPSLPKPPSLPRLF